MWPRAIEMMLGWWLIISPFIFRHDPAETLLRTNDMLAGALVVTFSMASFAARLQYARFGTLMIALWLIAFAFLTSGIPAAPAQQNQLALGLLLLMFGIVPNEANAPPKPWRDVRPES